MTNDKRPIDEVLDPLDDDRGAADAPEERAEAQAAETAPNIEDERDAYRDQLLRARAEFDNFRKRMERERQQMGARATEEAVRDILPIVDDLERALASDPGDAAGSFHQGVQMIHRQMIEMLRRRGVEPVDSIGQIFDPNIHEAVAYEPAEGRREGEIIGELRRGYRIGDRLVRPAMVRVAQELH